MEDQVWLLAHLSRWLDEQGLEPSALTVEAAERFRRARRERYANFTGPRALDPLLGTCAVSASCRSRRCAWTRRSSGC